MWVYYKLRRKRRIFREIEVIIKIKWVIIIEFSRKCEIYIKYYNNGVEI